MLKMILTYSHDLPAIELRGGSQQDHGIARSAVMDNWLHSPVYKMHTEAGAFLQGQSDNLPDLWTLIEFWRDNYAPFVEHLEKRLGVKCE